MPRSAPHPTLKTYEEFLANMSKENDTTKRYYFEQIQFAEKERQRLRDKERRRRERIKELLAQKSPENPPATSGNLG